MGLIKYILTHDTRVGLKRIGKMADKIMELSPIYEAMSEDELKAQTGILKEKLKILNGNIHCIYRGNYSQDIFTITINL